MTTKEAEIPDERLKEIAKLSAAIDATKERLEIIHDAKMIQGQLRNDQRALLEDRSLAQDKLTIAMYWAQTSPLYLEAIEQSTKHILFLAEGLLDNAVQEYDWLNSNDLEAIAAFIKTLQLLRSRSRTQLQQFMTCVRMGEDGLAVLRCKKGTMEARFRYRCPTDMTEWFELDPAETN